MQIGPDARVGCLTVISTINVLLESPQECISYPIPARCYTIKIPNTVLDVLKAGCIIYLGKVGSSSSEVDRKMLSRIVGSSIRSTLVTNY